MQEIIKKALLAGAGIAAYGEEKARALIEDLVKKGELSSQEGAKLVKSVAEKIEENRKEIDLKIETTVKKVMGALNLAKKDELEALKKKVEDLESRLNKQV